MLVPVLLAKLAAIGVLPGAGQGGLPRPLMAKLIEFGWDLPSTGFVREHIGEMEAMPFDGVVVSAEGTAGEGASAFHRRAFGPEALSRAEFEQAIRDLQATEFRRFTDNFLLVNVLPGTVDWFDDLSPIVSNMRLAAEIAREGGLRGVFFDIEPYGGQLWNYDKRQSGARSFAAYSRRLRTQGTEMAQALGDVFPDITVVFTFCYHMADVTDPWHATYGMLPAFLDGFFEGAGPQVRIVDGWESAYGYRTHEQLVDAYHWMHRRALSLCGARKAYKAHISAGFGVYLDCDQAKIGWHTDDFGKNYYTPDQLFSLVANALSIADDYVWLYAENPRWWTRENLPDEYVGAVRLARRDPRALTPAQLVLRQQWPLTPEGVALFQLLEKLPETWLRRNDPKNAGLEERWFLPDADLSAWTPVKTTEVWHHQPGGQLTGVAWGRAEFALPEDYRGRRLWLWFGALDECGQIFLNGRLAHDREPSSHAWATPFGVEVTDFVRYDAPNVLVVRAQAEGGLGGVWHPVWLATDQGA